MAIVVPLFAVNSLKACSCCSTNNDINHDDVDVSSPFGGFDDGGDDDDGDGDGDGDDDRDDDINGREII